MLDYAPRKVTPAPAVEEAAPAVAPRVQAPEVVADVPDDPGYLATYAAGDQGQGQAGTPVDQALLAVETATAAAGETEEGSQERDDATREAMRTLTENLAALGPDERRAYLEQAGPHLDTILANMDHLDADENAEVIAMLAGAAEYLGQDDVALLTDRVAENLPAMFDGHNNNQYEFMDGVQAAVENGHGALFGPALADSMRRAAETETDYYKSERLKSISADLAYATAEGVGEVMERFEEAQADFHEKEAWINSWLANNTQLVGPDAAAAAEAAFAAEHADTYETYGSAQQNYASILEGASYMTDNWAEDQSAHGMYQYAAQGAQDAFYHVPSLMEETRVQNPDGTWGRGTTGSDVMADAVLRETGGRTTFLGTASRLAEEGVFDERYAEETGEANPNTWSDQLDAAMLYGGVRASEALMRDSGGGLNLGGVDLAAEVMDTIGRLSPEMQDDMEAMADDIRAFQEEFQSNPDATASDWANGFSTVLSGYVRLDDSGQTDPNAPPNRRNAAISAFASSLSTIGAVSAYISDEDRTFGDHVSFGANLADGLLGATDNGRIANGGAATSRLGNVSKAAGRIAGGVGLITSLGDVIGAENGQERFSAFLGAGGSASYLVAGLAASGSTLATSATGIGTAFLAAKSLFDAGSLLADGNVSGAAVAALPAIGAAIGLIGGPFGAALGLGIGTLASIGLSALGVGSGDPNEAYEEGTEVAWNAAISVLAPGVSEETRAGMAEIFRNVDDNRVGVGPVLTLFAANAGYSPEEIMTHFAELYDTRGHAYVDDLIKNNVMDVDITNWSDIEDARERRRDEDPDTEIPGLHYDGSEMDSLTLYLNEIFQSGGRTDLTDQFRSENMNLEDPGYFQPELVDLWSDGGNRSPWGNRIESGRIDQADLYEEVFADYRWPADP